MYLLVKVRDVPPASFDAVELCKAIEADHPLVDTVIVTRTHTERYVNGDCIVQDWTGALYSTQAALERMSGNETDKYGQPAD
jgi:hypothetical protein